MRIGNKKARIAARAEELVRHYGVQDLALLVAEMEEDADHQETTFERVLTDGHGVSFSVRVELDRGSKLEREIVHLANRARASKTQKCAASAHGAIRVCVTKKERA